MLGGHAVAQCLRNEGVRHVFSVPGESYIAVVDGLVNFPEVKLITNRQEGCAAFMAEGYAKATRTPGVCIVTRGPGATNASIALHSARYDSAPMVLLVGQVSRAARGREAGQELDYTHLFGTIAKWVIEINDPKQIPRIVSRAFHIARSGRPGPVVVALPRDVTETDTEISMVDPYPVIKPSPDPAAIESLIGRINAAQKPVLLIGSEKAALYTRALVEDIVHKKRHLTDPRWLMRVGLYLEFLTCIGIFEAAKEDIGDLLTPAERTAYENNPLFAEIRKRLNPKGWKEVWDLREIIFHKFGAPQAGPVSIMNLLQKRKATLAFLEVHHQDLKNAIDLAGSNVYNAQETWHRVFRDAERAAVSLARSQLRAAGGFRDVRVPPRQRHDARGVPLLSRPPSEAALHHGQRLLRDQ